MTIALRRSNDSVPVVAATRFARNFGMAAWHPPCCRGVERRACTQRRRAAKSCPPRRSHGGGGAALVADGRARCGCPRGCLRGCPRACPVGAAQPHRFDGSPHPRSRSPLSTPAPRPAADPRNLPRRDGRVRQRPSAHGLLLPSSHAVRAAGREPEEDTTTGSRLGTLTLPRRRLAGPSIVDVVYVRYGLGAAAGGVRAFGLPE